METNVLQYIIEEALVLVPVLYIVGVIVKGIPRIPDWIIPFVLLLLGVMGAVLLMGFTAQAVIQGILVAGVTVLGNQLIKQAKKGENEG